MLTDLVDGVTLVDDDQEDYRWIRTAISVLLLLPPSNCLEQMALDQSVELDHQVLPRMVVAVRRDPEDLRDEPDDEVAVAFPDVQDAVAADGTAYHGVAFLGATS